MRFARRSLNVIRDILDATSQDNGECKTNIQKKSNIDHYQGNAVISSLIEMEYIEFKEYDHVIGSTKGKYHSTARGRELLRDLNNIERIVK